MKKLVNYFLSFLMVISLIVPFVPTRVYALQTTYTYAFVDATGLSALLSTSIIKNAFAELKNSEQYEVVSGHMPEDKNEIVLVVNKDCEINLSNMYSLNFENKNDVSRIMNSSITGEKVELSSVKYDYNKIIGKKYKLINAYDYYEKAGNAWISRENDTNYLND